MVYPEQFVNPEGNIGDPIKYIHMYIFKWSAWRAELIESCLPVCVSFSVFKIPIKSFAHNLFFSKSCPLVGTGDTDHRWTIKLKFMYYPSYFSCRWIEQTTGWTKWWKKRRNVYNVEKLKILMNCSFLTIVRKRRNTNRK